MRSNAYRVAAVIDGDRLDGLGLAANFMGDVAIVPDRLFAAADLSLATATSEGEERGYPW